MNYFVDFVPTDTFINSLGKLNKTLPPDCSLNFNLYVKQLPAMNVNSLLYFDASDLSEIVETIKTNGYGVNVMVDACCTGNIEYTTEGKHLFRTIDHLGRLGADYVTLTNHLVFYYVQKEHLPLKVIFSEYSEIDNAQKVGRYLEDIQSYAVKIKLGMLKNREVMKYISNQFDKKRIHIDLNKGLITNSIGAYFNNCSIAHYIQDGQWQKINNLLQKIIAETPSDQSDMLFLEDNEIDELIRAGYTDFWYYNNSLDPAKYFQNLTKFILGNHKIPDLYPWCLIH